MSDPLASDPDQFEASGPRENPVVKYFKEFKILKETKREYWWLQVINMLDCLAYFAMLNIVIVTLSKDFGFTDVGAGFVFGAFSITTTAFLFFSGVITDWLGIKRALYIAIFGLLLTRVGVVVVELMDEPVRLSGETELSVLHDGAGVPIVDGQPDLKITARDGHTFAVDLSGSKTIGALLEGINEDAGNGGRIVASIAPGWVSLRLTDTTSGEGDLIVGPTEANPSAAAALELVTEGESSSTFAGKRIISDLNGVLMTDINQGDGLGGGSVLEVTDRLGQTMTVKGLDQLRTVGELVALLEREAEAQPANVSFSLNAQGNGLRISDQNKSDDGRQIKDGNLVIGGDAAPALQIEATGESEVGGLVAGSSLVDNALRSWLTLILLILMAPFVAMLITIFQAGNRRFTTDKSRGAGFNLWYLFMNVGAAGGGFLIDIIYLRLGLPHYHVFTFGVVTGVLCLLVTIFFMKDCEQLRLSGDEEEKEEKPEEKKDKKGPVQIAIAVLSEPVFWRFTVLITLLLGVRAVFLYLGLLFPKYWYRVIGEDAQVGMMQAFNPVLVIIGLLLVIPALQKFNVYKMLVFGALITSVSMFIPAIPQMGGIDIVTWTYITTGVFLLVLTVGELIWSPRLSEYTAAIAPEGQEGTYLGLSMVPYFLAKFVISAVSGVMLLRWCQEYPPGEPNLGERLASGEIGFLDSPYMMWIILGSVALFGTIVAILGKNWFTKGAQFDAQ